MSPYPVLCWLVSACLAWSGAHAAQGQGGKASKAPAATAQKGRMAAKKSSAPVARAVLTPMPALSPAHLAVARQVVLGAVSCELGTQVVVSEDPHNPGYFLMVMGRHQFHMSPVLSVTGAVRLEAINQEAVWLQLSNKSMLMDQKQGRRLADACMNAAQIEVARAMELAPTLSLLEPLPTELPVSVVN